MLDNASGYDRVCDHGIQQPQVRRVQQDVAFGIGKDIRLHVRLHGGQHGRADAVVQDLSVLKVDPGEDVFDNIQEVLHVVPLGLFV